MAQLKKDTQKKIPLSTQIVGSLSVLMVITLLVGKYSIK